jgi:hypothetical protein
LLKDKGKGEKAGKRPLAEAVRLKIVTKTAQEKPANATHWTVRAMAKEVGVSHTTVQRIWKVHGLKPHLTRTFKLSNDPKFAEKVVDIVGLYLNPPEKAVVLCVDEKSQIQALDRTQRGLPLKKGRAERSSRQGRSLAGCESPYRQLPVFRRLAYPMRGEATNRVLLRRKSPGCPAGVFAAVGTIWGASKLGGRNITKYLRPQRSVAWASPSSCLYLSARPDGWGSHLPRNVTR